MKPNIIKCHKLIIHIVMNKGPQIGINEDIIEEIKEEPAQEEGDAEAAPLTLRKKTLSEFPGDAMRLDLVGPAKLNSALAVPLSIPEAANASKQSDAASVQSAGSRNSGGSRSKSARGKKKKVKRRNSGRKIAVAEEEVQGPARAAVEKAQVAFGKAVTVPEDRSEKSKKTGGS